MRYREIPGPVCVAVFVSATAGALIMVGGSGPVTDMAWPKGCVEMANLTSRFRYIEGPPFGGGEYRFEYRGGASKFNEALAQFAEIRAPKLELVVHDGPGFAGATNRDENEFVDWAFTIWNPRAFHRLHSNPTGYYMPDAPLFRMPLPPPRIDVYVSKKGRIKWDDVKIPPDIEVVDERAEAAGITPVDGGVVVGSVYSIGTGQPIKGSAVFLEPTPTNETSTATLSAICDEDGAFVLEQIPKGTYKVVVWAKGYAALQA